MDSSVSEQKWMADFCYDSNEQIQPGMLSHLYSITSGRT